MKRHLISAFRGLPYSGPKVLLGSKSELSSTKLRAQIHHTNWAQKFNVQFQFNWVTWHFEYPLIPLCKCWIWWCVFDFIVLFHAECVCPNNKPGWLHNSFTGYSSGFSHVRFWGPSATEIEAAGANDHRLFWEKSWP